MQCLFKKNLEPTRRGNKYASTLSRIEYVVSNDTIWKMFGVLDVPDDSA